MIRLHNCSCLNCLLWMLWFWWILFIQVLILRQLYIRYLQDCIVHIHTSITFWKNLREVTFVTLRPNPCFRHDGLADTESYCTKPCWQHDQLANTLLPLPMTNIPFKAWWASRHILTGTRLCFPGSWCSQCLADIPTLLWSAPCPLVGHWCR